MDNVVQNINIEDIVPNNHLQYNEREIGDLAASIKQLGLLEPITVRPKEGKYELILGNKRHKAAILAGLKKIPAIIKEIDDESAKKYSMINNNYLKTNDNYSTNSIENNLDVINLSKLNEEYERDELIMNNNQFENNNMPGVPTNNEPTFGGRFFPSLEDEPTNMNFNNNMPSQTQEIQQPANNFIDLTDLNIGNQGPQIPQNNFIAGATNIAQEPITNNIQQPIAPNMPIDNQQMIQNPMNDGNNILNLDSLKQNNMIEPQPMNQGINVDNNFQEVINDFSPNMNNQIPNQFGPQPINEMNPINEVTPSMPNMEPMMSQPINEINQEMIQPINEINPINEEIPAIPNMDQTMNQQPLEMNQDFIQPNNNNIMDQPIMEQNNVGLNIENSNEMMAQGNLEETPYKDTLPVINTLKALAVNLESFGYTIRITDEDLENSYKITIEVDK